MNPSSPPPKSFTLLTPPAWPPQIVFRLPGVGCITALLSVWLTVWTAACIAFVYKLVAGGSRHPQLLWLTIGFFVFEFLVLLALWSFRAVTTYSFHPHRLVVERKAWGIARTKQISRDDIKAVRQTMDSRKGQKSWDSWGLEAVASKPLKIISSQANPETVAWLGPIVAQWAGVEYQPLPRA